jgi:hypothetical protein
MSSKPRTFEGSEVATRSAPSSRKAIGIAL